MKMFTNAKSDGLDPGNTGYGAKFTLGEDKKYADTPHQGFRVLHN
jgi:hypothetical protein